MTNKINITFLALHGLSEEDYRLLCRTLNVPGLTALERPWVCPKCGFTRIFEESKQQHINWHERRMALAR